MTISIGACRPACNRLLTYREITEAFAAEARRQDAASGG